jgi:hypothetical protein
MAYLKDRESEAVNAPLSTGEIWAQERHDKWGPRFGLWLRLAYGI